MNEQADNNTAEGAEQPAIVVPGGLTGAEAEQFIQGELVRKEIERKQAAGEPLTADEEASLGVVAAKAAEAALEAAESAGEEQETEAPTETETETETPDPEQDSN